MTADEMQDAMAGQDEVAVERALDALFADVETFKLYSGDGDPCGAIALRIDGKDLTTSQLDDESLGAFIVRAIRDLRRLNDAQEPRYCWETPTGVNYFKAGQRWSELREAAETDEAACAERDALQDVMNRAYEMAE